MKTWSADNPKASLMKRKRGAIVEAARQAFLQNGYAQTSMERIAETAGVSIKTVYRHFENKDDLFSAVMQAACSPGGFEELKGKKQDRAPLLERPWFSKPPRTALVMAGVAKFQKALLEEKPGFFCGVNPKTRPLSPVGWRYREGVRRRGKTRFFSSIGSSV